ncbi:MAG: hypothetical protein FWD75_11015, partial [Propionibacteriaceae bacterium]|nr:hypothetical protein [Propionibacteriaceae bacterium]
MPDTTSAGTPPTDGQDAQSGAQGAPGGDAPWTPPASQQDLDRIIQDRLSRERAKYTDYEELKTKAGEYDKHVAATRS